MERLRETPATQQLDGKTAAERAEFEVALQIDLIVRNSMPAKGHAHTKVFISWSGDLSRRIAAEVNSWLPAVLQFVEPFFTPNDIEKGKRWDSEIATQLEASNIGVFVLTSKNLHAPWIAFEGGALSKRLDKSRVCTLLVDVTEGDVTGPLSRFQHTRFEKEDFKKFVKTVNAAAGDAGLEPGNLDRVFEKWWPDLNEKIGSILVERSDTHEQVRTDRDILEEILALCRNNYSSYEFAGSGSGSGAVTVDYHSMRTFIELATRIASQKAPASGREMALLEEFRDALNYVCAPSGSCDLWDNFDKTLNTWSVRLKTHTTTTTTTTTVRPEGPDKPQ